MTKNLIRSAALALGLTIALSACNADQLRYYWDAKGVDYSHLSDSEVDTWAAASGAWWKWSIAEAAKPKPPVAPAFTDKFQHVLNGDQLYRLRWCESGDNYRAVSSSGTYRGAYQFSRSTWNSVAKQHYPAYNGVDPINAPPHVQDAMTRALWSQMGRSPWPHCGKRV